MIYDCGTNYINYSSSIKNISSQMKELSLKIKEGWSGNDSEIFLSKYNNYIEFIDSVSSFLDNRAEFLKKNATLHSDVDNELYNQIKGSTMNEK